MGAILPEAYGVKAFGVIAVNTISSTERAAKVNYLVAEKRVAVAAWHSDSDIERMWRSFTDPRDEAVVALKIEERHHA